MMKELKTEIILNASTEQVWNALTDLDQYASWNPFIVSSKGEIKVGSKLTNTLLSKGKPTVTNIKCGTSYRYLVK